MTRDEQNGGSWDEVKRTPEEIAALRALERLPRPVASALTKERARAAFVRGEDWREEHDAPVLEVRSRPRFLPAFSLAFAFAVILAALLYGYGSRPAYQWYVTDVVAPEGVRVGETTPAVGDIVEAGPILTAAGSEIELQLGDQLRFRMLPGAEIKLPSSPGRWIGKSRSVEMIGGEIYGTTGDKPLDFAFRVTTREAVAQVFGTTFAVLRNDDGTCVCLWTGHVEVTPVAGDDATRLPKEMKFYVYMDGHTELLPINDMERMKLSMTHDAGLLPEPPSPSAEE